ncbi:glycogen/starch/alpha-glucan phosphorylase [Aerococcaceae bacterium zg-ZUI334]|uniref:glycogen/starch/alpha-glucan phosphorylase n=1 Tax=Aerococcaceae TaxID=186827 RepID=UPI0013BA0A94|nr:MULTISPECIES: glycogen/starch/alpha-glucan phosphorylase [unclassified Facklamia]MBR7927944.1 glycogen/starch/alpha-glucan phosphorylase [Aerococcaceae bacterium zg-ZUI334]NEW64926.1 glycogen/starch/alpha-glucan family phosphorylase [Facklamia sp. 252]NEW68248.1 glycogen/starch/alpha-glucan family phosphorylase [Facklamia sp. 253]QQD66091.1 glycogen/starch/alpha-glucan phosphorylase [Aerococcaceae bacterium zg-252]
MTLVANYAKNLYLKSIADCSEQELYHILFKIVRDRSEQLPTHHSRKKLYYFSAEFLIGKLLSNNLLNLGIYDEVQAELTAAGKNMMDIEQAENEPSLGNGGLGRLAACFVDSIATLGLNGDGIGLNYHFGLFRQVFNQNQQNAIPDPWLTEKNWVAKAEQRYTVPFKHFELTSTLYNLDVLGYGQDKKTRLRLFDLDSINSDIIHDGIQFDKGNIFENLTLFLYPDDSDHAGELLRIYQQYFMVSNGAQLILEEAVAKGSNLHDLADYAVIQINDTHPALVIPEMIRLLTERGIEMDEAIEIVRSMTAFTNHTILAEALEKWPLHDLEEVVPQLIPIIHILDEKMKEQYPNNPAVTIIDEYSRVHMAHLSIHYGYSVNGVAALHTDILKKSELKAFYDLYPEKFNNKTNGITFRRWLMDANPQLAKLLDNTIGTQWRKDSNLEALLDYIDDENVINELRAIKHNNKKALQERLKTTQGISINTHSIIDVQIKRMHEYKRQQMLALYIIHKYFAIKNGQIPATPITIIFGGKAAPAYTIAQDVIHLILNLSEIIANDPEVSPHLQVVMIENYNVTAATYLIPAANISEQISLASKEASGTGNMKFMLNGALTLGTLDGANVEIHQLVGDENITIFGKESDEIIHLYETNGYVAHDYYQRDAIKPLVDFIVSEEMLAVGNSDRLYRLHNELIHKDWFMTLIDLEEFIEAKEKMYAEYEDYNLWLRKSLVNIAKAGYFSADRTINDYNEDIWHLEKA